MGEIQLNIYCTQVQGQGIHWYHRERERRRRKSSLPSMGYNWPTFFFFATSKTATKSRGEKKFISYLFYVATNFTKMYIILILKCWRKKFGNFQRILELLEVWVWDPRSGIRNKPIPDRGVKKAPDPGSGSATLILWNLWLYKKVWQVFNSSLSFVAVFGSGMRDPGPYTACMA
jgi:hypothetical protein